MAPTRSEQTARFDNPPPPPGVRKSVRLQDDHFLIRMYRLTCETRENDQSNRAMVENAFDGPLPNPELEVYTAYRDTGVFDVGWRSRIYTHVSHLCKPGRLL